MNINSDVLNLDGLDINPVSNKKYSNKYIKQNNKLKKLPIIRDVNELYANLQNNKITLINTNIYSGIDLILPKLLLNLLRYKGKILVVSLNDYDVKKMSYMMKNILDLKVGRDIGYKIDTESEITNNNLITYATYKEFLKILYSDEYLNYDYIYLNNINKHNFSIKNVLLTIKMLLNKNKKLNLVMTTRGNNNSKYFDYFKNFNCIILNFKYDIDGIIKYKYYNKFDKNLIIENTVDILKNEIFDNNEKVFGDILIYLPNKYYFNKLITNIKKIKNNQDKKFLIIEINDFINHHYLESMDLTFKKGKYDFKIYINYSSYIKLETLNNVNFIIDSGYTQNFIYNSDKDIINLENNMITKEESIAREHISNFNLENTIYKLYKNNEYNKMLDNNYNNIVIDKNKFSKFFINLYGYLYKREKTNDVRNITKIIDRNFLDIDKKLINNSINVLKSINSIDYKTINKLSLIYYEFDIKPAYTRMILESIFYDCSTDIILLCSILNYIKNTNQIFTNKNKVEIPKNLICNYSDHITLINIFMKILEKKTDESIRQFCENTGLDIYVVIKILNKYKKLRKTYDNVIKKVSHIKIKKLIKFVRYNKYSNKNDKLIHCILSSLHTNFCKKVNNTKNKFRSCNPKVIENGLIEKTFMNRNLINNSKYIIYENFYNYDNSNNNVFEIVSIISRNILNNFVGSNVSSIYNCVTELNTYDELDKDELVINENAIIDNIKKNNKLQNKKTIKPIVGELIYDDINNIPFINNDKYGNLPKLDSYFSQFVDDIKNLDKNLKIVSNNVDAIDNNVTNVLNVLEDVLNFYNNILEMIKIRKEKKLILEDAKKSVVNKLGKMNKRLIKYKKELLNYELKINEIKPKLLSFQNSMNVKKKVKAKIQKFENSTFKKIKRNYRANIKELDENLFLLREDLEKSKYDINKANLDIDKRNKELKVLEKGLGLLKNKLSIIDKEKLNPWIEYIKKLKKKHPNKMLKNILKMAQKFYWEDKDKKISNENYSILLENKKNLIKYADDKIKDIQLEIPKIREKNIIKTYTK